MRIKYVEVRANTAIYQRGIRTSVRERYGGQKKIAVDLKTKDPVKVGRLVAQLNAQLEAEWDALEQDPKRSPRAIATQADILLKRSGLRPLAKDESAADVHDPMALQLLHDQFDSKREAYAGGDEVAYREAHPTDYLSSVEVAAWQRLYVPPVDTVNDVLRVYLDTHQKQGDGAAKFQRDTRAAFSDLVAVASDKPAKDVTRRDAHAFVAARLDEGDSTATVRRKLNTLVAAWTRYRREQAPDLANPFEALPIPNEGQDKKPRVPFTVPQLETLYAACRRHDDDIRWLFALMIDTGARLAEVTGLAIADIRLDGPTPYMALVNHPWRTIKGKPGMPGQPRDVPLVGASLWAARRIVERAREMTGTDAAVYAFPRYNDGRKCKATNASNTLVKWVEKTVGRGVNHELRHSLKDRLREVECPKPINDAICGHSSQDVGDGYGHGYSLRVKHEWLAKVALPEPKGAA